MDMDIFKTTQSSWNFSLSISIFFHCHAIFPTVPERDATVRLNFDTHNVQFRSINTCDIYLLDVPKTNLINFLKFPQGKNNKIRINSTVMTVWLHTCTCSSHSICHTLGCHPGIQNEKNRAIPFRGKKLEH